MFSKLTSRLNTQLPIQIRKKKTAMKTNFSVKPSSLGQLKISMVGLCPPWDSETFKSTWMLEDNPSNLCLSLLTQSELHLRFRHVISFFWVLFLGMRWHLLLSPLKFLSLGTSLEYISMLLDLFMCVAAKDAEKKDRYLGQGWVQGAAANKNHGVEGSEAKNICYSNMQTKVQIAAFTWQDKQPIHTDNIPRGTKAGVLL